MELQVAECGESTPEDFIDLRKVVDLVYFSASPKACCSTIISMNSFKHDDSSGEWMLLLSKISVCRVIARDHGISFSRAEH